MKKEMIETKKHCVVNNKLYLNVRKIMKILKETKEPSGAEMVTIHKCGKKTIRFINCRLPA